MAPENAPTTSWARRYSSAFDLSPSGIIRMLDLRRPIYRQTAAYGHFGRTDIAISLGAGRPHGCAEGKPIIESLSIHFRIKRQTAVHSHGCFLIGYGGKTRTAELFVIGLQRLWHRRNKARAGLRGPRRRLWSEAVDALEVAHGVFGPFVVAAGDIAVVILQLVQGVLQVAHIRTGIAADAGWNTSPRPRCRRRACAAWRGLPCR